MVSEEFFVKQQLTQSQQSLSAALYVSLVVCYLFFVLFHVHFCQRKACRPHSNIVMTLNNIFVYMFPETGWIWMKLGRAMGAEKRANV